MADIVSIRRLLGPLVIALLLGQAGEAAAQAFETPIIGAQVKAKLYDDTCADGSVLIGMHYGAGKDLDYVQPLCRPLDNDRLGAQVVALKTLGDQTQDDSRVDATLACPAGSAVHDMYVFLSSHGAVHAFAFRCFDVDPASGAGHETARSATKGGASTSNSDADCGPNAWAVGMNIAVSGLIQRLGLSCLPIVFPPLEPATLPVTPPPVRRPPHPVDNSGPPHAVDNGG